MRRPPRWILALALALPIVPLSARAQGGAAGSVTIGKIDSIFSPTLKEQRPYLVYTPPSYSDTTYTKRGYPCCTCWTVTRTSTP